MREIEKQFAEMFPNEIPFMVGKLLDGSGCKVQPIELVSKSLKHWDTITAIQDVEPENIAGLFKKEETNDILDEITNFHHTVASKLTNAYLNDLDDKIAAIRKVMPLCLSDDKATV